MILHLSGYTTLHYFLFFIFYLFFKLSFSLCYKLYIHTNNSKRCHFKHLFYVQNDVVLVVSYQTKHAKYVFFLIQRFILPLTLFLPLFFHSSSIPGDWRDDFEFENSLVPNWIRNNPNCLKSFLQITFMYL